ncbi:MAG: P-II family nitrogen regulator [Clostridia bacterium]|nr:P-II family nitrogen regulator [Clostridia bacterium]
MDKKFELIVSIVNRGHSDAIVEAAREAGANGGTIIYGRGTSPFEKDSIMGVSIQPEKEIIMTLTPTENKNNIMQAVVEGGKLDENGMGICFSLPVNQVRGISAKYSIKNIKKEEKAEDKKED